MKPACAALGPCRSGFGQAELRWCFTCTVNADPDRALPDQALADRLGDNLARAEALVKQFGKRMAGDKFIQCFAVINCLLFLGVIIWAIFKGKGGDLFGGDNDAPANPVDSSRRMLMRGNIIAGV